MSDSESAVSCLAETPPVGVSWSRKRRMKEKAAKMRMRKRFHDETEADDPAVTPESSVSRRDRESPRRSPLACPDTHERPLSTVEGLTESSEESDKQPEDSSRTDSPGEGQRTSVLSPQSRAWSLKRTRNLRAARMRAAKQPASELEEEEIEAVSHSNDPDFGYRSDEEPDENRSSSEEEFNSQEIFDDWMVSLRLDQRKMLAVILMESFKGRQKMNVKDAAQEAGSIVGFNEKTIRRYQNDFFSNEGQFTVRQQGKYERHCVYHDEELNLKAAAWVREHGFVKGAPNMTAQSFCDWTNNDLLLSSHLPPYFPRTISLRTAIRWLHHLGFRPVSHKKGVYIDDHEREDVVSHRESLLKTLSELRSSHQPPPLCSDEPPRIRQESDEDKKKLVVIYHDESIFNTNEGQTWMWGEDDRPAILPKTKGSGIMVSDFVEEHGGYLKLTQEEFDSVKLRNPNIVPAARRLLEYGAEREGYWTGDRFMEQMLNAAEIAEAKYSASSYTLVWLFDQSSCHR